MPTLRHVLPILAVSCLAGAPALAAELEVVVTGVTTDRGTIGCSLHREAQGFPGSGALAEVTVQPGQGTASCRFSDLQSGRYAVAVAHDVNGNGRIDTNFLGIPQEPWAVSGNVRPLMRAPNFNEAAFDLGEGPHRIEISLTR
ncbi:MAG: DUF2141 domain-containing protein [Alphaproteobacteria bacterium]|nr:DUF2141 domain-containing protein [Alphaproteobacteria bacterium]